MSNIARQLNLVFYLLNSNKGITLRNIIENIPEYRDETVLERYYSTEERNDEEVKIRFEALRKKFLRDKQDLIEAGIPIETNDENTYYIDKNKFYLPALKLNTEETFLVLVLKSMLAGIAGTMFTDNVNSAIWKLGFLFSEEEKIYGTKKEIPTELRKITDLIFTATKNQKIINAVYKPLNKQKQNYKLMPYALYSHQTNWYLVAYEDKTKDIRVYKLSRFKKVEFANENLKIADFTMPENFKLSNYANRESWEFAEGKEINVKVKFSPLKALEIEKSYQKKIKKDKEGNFIFLVSSPERFLRFIVKFGNQATILEPTEIKNKFINYIKNIKKLYG